MIKVFKDQEPDHCLYDTMILVSVSAISQCITLALAEDLDYYGEAIAKYLGSYPIYV